MKTINTSLFDFPRIVRDFVYVDKTAQIYKIARPDSDCLYFLSRPRRFGKSLLVSTLKALFEGRRELFRGLAIDETDWDWEHEVYPVLHLDMSTVSAPSAELLERNLQQKMKENAEAFGLPHDPTLSAAVNFSCLLKGLHRKSLEWQKAHFPDREADGRIVVLIDEYDAPVAKAVDAPNRDELLPQFRSILHDFYVNAKADSGNMRFLFVTGVSKFAKLSVFSAFNNPTDLSLDARAADLLGYTHEEMERHFHGQIQAFADANDLTYDEAFARLLAWYDGYQFCPERLVKVINPVSLGRALANGVIRNYWEATAGSTLVYAVLKAQNKLPVDLEGPVKITRLDAPDALTAPLVALLYQGGYLTIDERIDGERSVLRIPNAEVFDSLHDGYLAELLGRDFEIDAFEMTAEESADDALAQCRERNYAAKFADDPRPVWYVGVNYNPADGVRTVDEVKAERVREPAVRR